MKRPLRLFLASLCSCSVVSFVPWTGEVSAQPFPGGTPGVLGSSRPVCEAEKRVFPGDGYGNPDAVLGSGVRGHGPALSYTDNGDGTFTDSNTCSMWEIKTDDAGSIHHVADTYSWPDAFTVFVRALNNSCRNDERVACGSDNDCAPANGGPGGACGFAGYRDWCMPHVKLLESIVDYSIPKATGPATTVPGETIDGPYWSATVLNSAGAAWVVGFAGGGVADRIVSDGHYVRAVRPCPAVLTVPPIIGTPTPVPPPPERRLTR